ncbi:MAG: hypothetical protein FH756_18855 [Firmicutes bacterium]|nr:hypothetical protein [Bacillota bacterium]
MDRFFRGFVAGVVGGVIMNIWSVVSVNLLHLSKFHYLDWAAVMTFGYPSGNILESLMSLATHLVWTGFLGIVAAYFLSLTTSKQYLLKGILIGFTLFFIINALPVLFHTPYLHNTTFGTSVSNAIGSIVWGLGVAWTLRYLDTTSNVQT